MACSTSARPLSHWPCSIKNCRTASGFLLRSTLSSWFRNSGYDILLSSVTPTNAWASLLRPERWAMPATGFPERSAGWRSLPIGAALLASARSLLWLRLAESAGRIARAGHSPGFLGAYNPRWKAAVHATRSTRPPAGHQASRYHESVLLQVLCAASDRSRKALPSSETRMLVLPPTPDSG